VECADHARILDDTETISSVGEIVVRAFRRGKGSRVRGVAGTMVSNGVTEIAEKALKGHTLSHTTQYVPPDMQGCTYYHARYETAEPFRPLKFMGEAPFLDGIDNPFAVYRFKYRSKGLKSKQCLLLTSVYCTPYGLQEAV
jgi:hypothetical protein